jgi:hypothetical protein
MIDVAHALAFCWVDHPTVFPNTGIWMFLLGAPFIALLGALSAAEATGTRHPTNL